MRQILIKATWSTATRILCPRFLRELPLYAEAAVQHHNATAVRARAIAGRRTAVRWRERFARETTNTATEELG